MQVLGFCIQNDYDGVELGTVMNCNDKLYRRCPQAALQMFFICCQCHRFQPTSRALLLACSSVEVGI